MDWLKQFPRSCKLEALEITVTDQNGEDHIFSAYEEFTTNEIGLNEG